MDMLLTGTGPAGGFPIPGCSCAPCRASQVRGSTGALQPAAPLRRPAELRLGERYRLDIDGVLHESGAAPHRLRGGDQVERPGLGVRALGRDGEPISLLIRTDDGPSLLWAPQSGKMSGATLADLTIGLAGTVLGTAVVGPAADDDPDQPTTGSAALECALLLARLRAIEAVDVRTRCLLVGLGHRQGPADRLALCLAHWRAQAPVDGTALDPDGRHPGPAVGTDQPDGSALPVELPGELPAELLPDLPFDPLDVPEVLGGRTLVLGGSASGKSGLAEDLLAAEPDVMYTATGPVVDLRTAPDAEWAQRVRRHRERRPAWWRTEETHLVAELLWKTPQPILLDSIGTWLTGVLDRAGAWQDQDDWRDRVATETDALVRAWRARRAPLVAVSDEVGLGVVPDTTSGRLFRDELGRLNRRLADESEQVLVVVAGRLLASPLGAPLSALTGGPGTGVGSNTAGPQ